MIPIILGAAALVTTGIGAASGVEGIAKMKEAKELGKAAQERYQTARESVEAIKEATTALAAEYGQLQMQVHLETIGRFTAFVEKIGQRTSQSQIELLKLPGMSLQDIQEYKQSVLSAKSLMADGVKAAATAYGAQTSAITLVGLFGTASTGTAISSLSGAAAINATAAWFGGGALAVGGGGMALGGLVLGGIAVGPALMVGGFALKGKGEKILTEAKQYEAKVNVAIEKFNASEDFLEQVQQRIIELKNLVQILNDRATESLEKLESRPFDQKRDALKFQQTALLVRALSQILKTPVLDAEGNLNPHAATLEAKYSKTGETWQIENLLLILREVFNHLLALPSALMKLYKRLQNI